MDFLRRYGIMLLIGVVLVTALIVNRIDTNQRAEDVKQAAITVCTKANARHALTSAFQRRVAFNINDPQIAEAYGQFARGSASYLDIAEFIDDPTRAVQVQVKVLPDGKRGLVLTEGSEKLIREGCELTFQE